MIEKSDVENVLSIPLGIANELSSTVPGDYKSLTYTPLTGVYKTECKKGSFSRNDDFTDIDQAIDVYNKYNIE